MIALWWDRLPATLGKRWPLLSAVFSDGRYLLAWPLVASASPLLAIAAGALLAYATPHALTFTGSLGIMSIVLMIGSISAGLGAWTVIGYGLADFVLLPHPLAYSLPRDSWLAIARVRVPLLIAYLLLFALAALVPAYASLLGRTGARRRRAATAKLGAQGGRDLLGIATRAIVAMLLTWAWTLSVPTLIRPLFTWNLGRPPLAAIRPLQSHGWWLTLVAAGMVLIRSMLEWLAQRRATSVTRAAPIVVSPKARAASAPSSGAWRIITTPLRAALVTLVFAGLIGNWLEAALLLCILILTDVVRLVVSAVPAWRAFIARVPLLARLATAMAVSCVVARLVLAPMWHGDDFTPMILGLGASLLVFAALLPIPVIALPTSTSAVRS